MAGDWLRMWIICFKNINRNIALQDIIADGKKRRKKKLKKSLSQANSEPVDNDSPESMSTTNDQSLPDEMIQIKQEQPAATMQDDQVVKSSQAMPINLTNEHGKVKTEVDSLGYGTPINDTMEINEFSNTVCKIGEHRTGQHDTHYAMQKKKICDTTFYSNIYVFFFAFYRNR